MRWSLVSSLLLPARPLAQQRPLVTEDPEPIGAGRVLHRRRPRLRAQTSSIRRPGSRAICCGPDDRRQRRHQLDRRAADRRRRCTIGCRSRSAIAAPLSQPGDGRPATPTRDVEDLVIGTKIRLIAEAAGRPRSALRFATKLPNASNESGLGLDTTDFYASLLGRQDRAVDPRRRQRRLRHPGRPDRRRPPERRADLRLVVGTRADRRAEIVGEVNGRVSTRSGGPFPGTESRGILTIGGRYTPGSIRFDGGLLSASPRSIRRSGSPAASRTCSTRSRCHNTGAGLGPGTQRLKCYKVVGGL